jgi:hypothetical protein
LGERRLCKAEVRGSNPLGSTPLVDGSRPNAGDTAKKSRLARLSDGRL